MHPSAQAWMCHPIGLFVVPEESVPQRGTRMSSPVQARVDRSAGMEKSSYMDCEVTRGVTRAFYAHQYMTIQRWASLIDTIFNSSSSDSATDFCNWAKRSADYFMRFAQFSTWTGFNPVGVSLNLRDSRRACSQGYPRRLRLRAPQGAKACPWFSLIYWDPGHPHRSMLTMIIKELQNILKKVGKQEIGLSSNPLTVLILVLVEYALWRCAKAHISWKRLWVLILVLVEYALWLLCFMVQYLLSQS